MKSLQLCFTGLVLLFLLGACNLRTGQLIDLPTSTITTTPTVTKAPTITPIPTPTRRATFSEFLTATRGPSVTPMPLLTPIPSNIVLTIQALLTESRRGAARQPYQCKILDGYPEPGAIFKPKEGFQAIWRVVNTGLSAWTIHDAALFYRWGARLQPLTYREDFIPYVVNPKDQLNLHVPMHAPVEPGVYGAVWGLRSKGTQKFFCNLTIIIVVEDTHK